MLAGRHGDFVRSEREEEIGGLMNGGLWTRREGVRANGGLERHLVNTREPLQTPSTAPAKPTLPDLPRGFLPHLLDASLHVSLSRRRFLTIQPYYLLLV